MLIVVMGVAGAGKTTVGLRLAAARGLRFYDADDFHSAAAIAKMAAGHPLDDTDRAPWIERLAALVEEAAATRSSIVLAVSALKERYRARLRVAASAHDSGLCLVYLRVSPETARRRVAQRSAHYMPPILIESQFDALEEPDQAIVVDADEPLEFVIAELEREIARSPR